MKFQFIISQTANQFFFISNLAEWHFSCRKEYNQKWIEQTGQLTEREKQIIDKFKKIITKYGFFIDKNGKTKYLGQYFRYYSPQKAWRQLKKNIGPEEFDIIVETFRLFRDRFEKIWDEKLLKNQVKKIKHYLDTENAKNLFKKIYYVLGNEKSQKNFSIIALASPIKGAGITAAGGANLDDYYLTLEIPVLQNNSWELEYSIGVLTHEIGHILFKQFKIPKLKLSKFLPSNLRPKINIQSFLTELSIELLVPFGFLAQKYFKKFDPLKFSFSKSNLKVLGENFLKFKNNKPASMHRLRKFLVWQIYPIVVHQIESGGKFDKNFLKFIAILFLNLIKK